MKVTIIGTGYVGLVTGACLAEAGHEVVCVDLDREKVEAIERGQAPLYEPGLQEILARHAGGSLRATTDLPAAVGAADLTMLAVGTPSHEDGSIDLQYVEAAAESVGRALRGRGRPHVVVVKSTVLPGTTSDRVRPIVETASGRTAWDGLSVAMNPEFLREGNAVQDFAHPDRVVLGVDDDLAEARLRSLYAPLSPSEVVVTTPRAAEMIKYASNALLATLISFSNEMGNLAARLPGVDVREVMAAVKADERWSPRQPDGSRVRPGILSYLEAGCGFGGSCFPKDLQALRSFSRAMGSEPRMLNAVLDINDEQPEEVVGLLERGLGSLQGRRVGVLGLAFKPNTDDVRESPSLKVIRSLRARGADVRAFDPVARETAGRVLNGEAELTDDMAAAVDGADGVAVMTAWPEFLALGELIEQMRVESRNGATSPLVVDGRRMLDGIGYARYSGIGLGPR